MEIRDRALAKKLRAAFRRDARLAGVRLTIDVRGAVAHISGTVSGKRELMLVRGAAAGVRGIEGVWDVLARGAGGPVVLDIGCGSKKQVAGAIGLDRFDGGKVDVVADLEAGLPFAGSSVDYVFAVHCLEHVHDLLSAMAEIHRVLAPWGAAHIMVPSHVSPNAVADPTHVRFFNRQTFKYFCRPRRGIPLFRPVIVSDTGDNILADLCPVKPGMRPATDEELSLFFD